MMMFITKRLASTASFNSQELAFLQHVEMHFITQQGLRIGKTHGTDYNERLKSLWIEGNLGILSFNFLTL